MSLLTGMQFEPPPLYFAHIPKTAGVALSGLLASAYGTRNRLSLWVPHQFAEYTLHDLRKYRCCTCHWGPGLYELIGRTDFILITMLRDPVERVLSAILYHQEAIKYRSKHWMPDYLERMQPFVKADMRACLEAAEFTEIARNGQTAYLGISRDYRPYLKDGEIGGSVHKLQWPMNNAPQKNTDQAKIAAQARKWLESMAVVGITERFSESVELICEMIGIRPPADLPKKNIGSGKPSVDVHGYRATIPRDLIERIEELNCYDRELYQYACDRFEQQLDRFRAQPHRTYSIAPRLRKIFIEPLHTGWRNASQRWPGLKKNRAIQQAKNIIKQVV
jgi:hypothetical protein